MSNLKDLFHTELGVHCQFSTIANVVKYYNKSIRDTDLFFNGGYFNTEYRRNEHGTLQEVKLTNNFSKVYNLYLAKYGIDYTFKPYEGTAEDFTAYVKNATLNLEPVMVVVRTDQLTYSSAYQTGHVNKHAITILDIQDNEFFISDCYVPTNPNTIYTGVMSFEEFSAAWNPYNNIMIEIDGHKVAKAPIAKPVTKSVAKSFVGEKDGYLKCCINQESESLRELAKDIKNLTQLFSSTDIYENMSGLCFKIQFDSIIPARKLLLKAVRQSSYSNDNSIIIKDINRFINRWQNIVYILLKASKRLSQSSLDKIHDSINILIEDEQNTFQKFIEEAE